VVALIGLLGILLGEQIVPVGRELIAGTSIGAAWRQARCEQHVSAPCQAAMHNRLIQRQTLASARCSHERTEPSRRSHP